MREIRACQITMSLILLNDMCLVPKLAMIHNNCKNLKHQISLIFTAMLTKKTTRINSVILFGFSCPCNHCHIFGAELVTIFYLPFISDKIVFVVPLIFVLLCGRTHLWPLNIEYVNILTYNKSVVLKEGDTKQVDPIVMTDMEHFHL